MNASLAPHLTKSLFLQRLICYLMPYFAPLTKNLDRAEADIIETLASYGARTRSELLNVVQILAYSMSGLELLTTAKMDTTLSPSLQNRLRGCANNLNRSAHQAEKALGARLKCDLPTTRPEPPAEPRNDATPAQTEEILHRIDTQIATARSVAPQSAATETATTQPAAHHVAAPHPAGRQKGSAMFDALFAEMDPPSQPPASQPPAPQPPAR